MLQATGLCSELRSRGCKLQATKGLTLIEMLVVVSLVSLVGVMGTRFLFSTLRANRKSESLARIKQSGDYAIKIMAREIRNAQVVDTCGLSMSSISLDGAATVFTCNNVQGYIEKDGASLTTGGSDIALNSCSFSCDLGTGGSPDSVTISFTLQKAPVGIIEERVTMNFSTKVSLRTY